MVDNFYPAPPLQQETFFNFEPLAEETGHKTDPTLHLEPDIPPLLHAEIDLPFDVPEDLPVLEPSESSSAEPQPPYPPYPEARSKPPVWQFLLLASLILATIVQIAWLTRNHWLPLPQGQWACAWLDCSRTEPRAPASFRILQRQLLTDPQHPDTLRLQARVRNDADFAQPLPDLQLSLLNNLGTVIARRRLSPEQYRSPAPSKTAKIAAGEVFTIDLLFADPGTQASGFKIQFL